jgi:hypothetical protein
VEGVGAGAGDGVQYRSVPAVLRAIGVRQDLEFADRVDAKARSENARAGSAILVGLDIGAVHQNFLPVGAGS